MALASYPSSADRTAGKPLFFWAVVLVGAVALGFYIFAGVMVYRYGALTTDAGWRAAFTDGRLVISRVDAQGAAAGKLQVGDQILAINDDTRVSRIGASHKLIFVSVGGAYTLRALRGAVEYHFELQIPPPRRGVRNLRDKLPLFVVSLAWYILAMLIGLLKPEERTARLAYAASLSSGLVILGGTLGPFSDLFQGRELTAFLSLDFIAPLHLPLAYHFYYHFPPGVPRGRFWSFLKYFLYVFAVSLYAIATWRRVVMLQGVEERYLDWMFTHFALFRTYRNLGGLLFLLAFFAMCAVIIRNYRLVREPDQRRRIKWLVYGSTIGIFPLALTELAFFAFRLNQVSPGEGMALLIQVENAATIIIPVTAGYAILKHRVFDIHVVIRRSLQYLLAKNSLRVLLSLPVVGLALAIVANPDRTVKEILIDQPVYLVLVAAAALSLKFRRQLSAWMDRKFFREAYHQERILLELIEEIKELDSMPEISGLVSKQVEAALHPQRIYVFYRGEEKRELTLGYSSGGRAHDLRIAETSQLLRHMESERSAQQFPLPPKAGLPPSEAEWLANLGVNLIVPMSGSDGRLAGLLLLGEKKSEEPYTPNDCKLLQAIAAQMAVVYENVWLKEQAAREQKIKHEVLARFEEQQINLVKECPACGACYDSAVAACAKDGRELTLTLPVERTIDGKYRLEQMIGRGGMGAVYEATDLRLSRQVAIKIMLGQMFGDRAALRRFEREAQASARLNHPNIITIYDYGRIRADGAYLVMELVRGFTLRSELRRTGSLNPQVAAEWFEQLLEGVEAAHQAGVIHRDLKPENVLISSPEKGRALLKILDFGLAKIRQLELASPNSLTAPGTVLGTLSYMSPEQLSGDEIDERSDIFALGVMVAEALTGGRPFSGKTSTELIASILHTPFHLKGEGPEVRRLDEVLQRCLAKGRGQRYATVAALQAELIPALAACPALASAAVASDEDATTSLPTA